MPDTTYTLSKFFDIKKQEEKQKEKLLKSPSFQKIKEKISEQKMPVQFSEKFYETIVNMIIERLSDLLNIDIIKDIFAYSWSKQQELSEYTDEEKYPPNTTVMVPILEHSLGKEYEHLVEPKMSKIKISIEKIKLQTEATFNIESAILEIRNAKIMKIHLGNVSGEGVIKFAGIPFLEKENTELSIPANIDLAPGISLPKTDQNDEDSAAKDSHVDLFPLLI